MRNDILILVQARTGSSRLPSKVLLPLGDKSVLTFLVERIQRNKITSQVVVATTVLEEDLPIVEECRTHRIAYTRGHPSDLLDRHYQAAKAFGAKHVVKIPSDCPLIDPKVIDAVLAEHLLVGADYTSNLHPVTHPDGNDVEVFTIEALTQAWREAKAPEEREHTTPYFWTVPGRFSVHNVTWNTPREISPLVRLTLDYVEDYAFLNRVVDAFAPGQEFGLPEILNLLEQHPEHLQLNAKWVGDSWLERSPRFKEREERLYATSSQ